MNEDEFQVLQNPIFHDDVVFAYLWYKRNYERLMADLISKGILQKR